MVFGREKGGIGMEILKGSDAWKAGTQTGKAIVKVANLLYETEFADNTLEFLMALNEAITKELRERRKK